MSQPSSMDRDAKGVVRQALRDGVGVIRALEDAELRKHFAGLSGEQRIREFFYDSNCGLPNERAWSVLKERPADQGKLFAQYSIEGVAWVNDTFGHDAGQILYRTAAAALQAADGSLAKVGGDFAGRVETEADAMMLAKIATRRLPPEFRGMKITAAVGETWEKARANHDQEKQLLEAAGARARRGTRPLGLAAGWTPEAPAHWGPPTPERPVPGRVEPPLDSDLRAAYMAVALTPEGVERAAYRDRLTGLLGHTGMGVVGRRGDQTLSIDVDGLRVTDETNPGLGDAVLTRVGMVMARLQERYGEEMYAARPHGDEFAARHPDERLLTHYAEKVKSWLGQEVVVYTSLETGLTYTQKGIGLSYGVGATADIAEANLKRDKAERVLRGERDPKGERLVAAGRLEVRVASPEELEEARRARDPGRVVPAVARQVVEPEMRAALMRQGIHPETLEEPALRDILPAVGRAAMSPGEAAGEAEPKVVRNAGEPVKKVFVVGTEPEALALWQLLCQKDPEGCAVVTVGGRQGERPLARVRDTVQSLCQATPDERPEVVVSLPREREWGGDSERVKEALRDVAPVRIELPTRESWRLTVAQREREWIRQQGLGSRPGLGQTSGVAR